MISNQIYIKFLKYFLETLAAVNEIDYMTIVNH